MVLGQATEILHGVPILVLCGAIETDHDLTDIGYIRQLLDDALECVTL